MSYIPSTTILCDLILKTICNQYGIIKEDPLLHIPTYLYPRLWNRYLFQDLCGRHTTDPFESTMPLGSSFFHLTAWRPVAPLVRRNSEVSSGEMEASLPSLPPDLQREGGRAQLADGSIPATYWFCSVGKCWSVSWLGRYKTGQVRSPLTRPRTDSERVLARNPSKTAVKKLYRASSKGSKMDLLLKSDLLPNFGKTGKNYGGKR